MRSHLNLGCGRAQFPTTPGNPFTQHLQQLPPSALDPEIRWTNVDRVPLEGVDEVVDLFCYPWVRSSNGNPWSDSSVAEIWCSHIVEHIPHTPRWAPAAYNDRALMQAGAIDGWFAFFYEAWRVLMPGGRLYIVAPYAFSTAGVSDPTHTRYITPASFGYLKANPNAPFHYQFPGAYEAVGDPLMRPTTQGMRKIMPDAPTAEMKEIDDMDEVYIILEAVKDETGL